MNTTCGPHKWTYSRVNNLCSMLCARHLERGGSVTSGTSRITKSSVARPHVRSKRREVGDVRLGIWEHGVWRNFWGSLGNMGAPDNGPEFRVRIVGICEYGCGRIFFGLIGNVGTPDNGLWFRLGIVGIWVWRNCHWVTREFGNLRQRCVI